MDPKTVAAMLHKYYGTDARAAEQIGVNQSTVWMIRHGKTDGTYTTYRKMMAALGDLYARGEIER